MCIGLFFVFRRFSFCCPSRSRLRFRCFSSRCFIWREFPLLWLQIHPTMERAPCLCCCAHFCTLLRIALRWEDKYSLSDVVSLARRISRSGNIKMSHSVYKMPDSEFSYLSHEDIIRYACLTSRYPHPFLPFINAAGIVFAIRKILITRILRLDKNTACHHSPPVIRKNCAVVEVLVCVACQNITGPQILLLEKFGSKIYWTHPQKCLIILLQKISSM